MNPKEQLAGLVEKWRGQANVALRRSGTWNGNDVADRIEFMADDLAAILSTLPEPGVVADEAVHKLACWMAEKDGNDDPHTLIWEGSPPQPWGEVWNRYEDDARAALEAALPYLGPAAPAGEVDKYQACGCGFEDFRGNYESCPLCGESMSAPAVAVEPVGSVVADLKAQAEKLHELAQEHGIDELYSVRARVLAAATAQPAAGAVAEGYIQIAKPVLRELIGDERMDQIEAACVYPIAAAAKGVGRG